jgi:hypothetical protein
MLMELFCVEGPSARLEIFSARLDLKVDSDLIKIRVPTYIPSCLKN